MITPADNIDLTHLLLAGKQQVCDTAAWSVVGSKPDSLGPQLSKALSLPAPARTATLLDGIPGEPLPYQQENDIIAVGLWMLALFALTATFLRFRSLLHAGWWQAVNAPDTEVPSLSLHWWDYLLTFLAASITLIFVGYSASGLGSSLSPAEPRSWLTITIAIGAVFVVLFVRLLLQSFINAIFWSSEAVKQWKASFLLATATAAILFFFAGLAKVYYYEVHSYIPYILLGIYGLFKIFLLFNEIRIFSAFKTSFSHIFLYICTLEILPLFFLWKGIEFLSSNTTLTDIF